MQCFLLGRKASSRCPTRLSNLIGDNKYCFACSQTFLLLLCFMQAIKIIYLFLLLFFKLWPKILHEGAVSIVPPPGWSNTESLHSKTLKIAPRKQALLHVPFAGNTPHAKVLHGHCKARSTPSLEMENKSG